MSKMTILDKVLVAFESLGKSQLPTWQIYSQVKKIREQHNQNVGDFDCLNHTFIGVFWIIQEDGVQISLR